MENRMKESAGKRIEFLDATRAIAIIMVVGVHANGYCLPLPHSTEAFIRFLVYQISVPVFFLVDGYLFGNMLSQNEYPQYLPYIRKSARRLLVPWVLFTLFYAVMRYIFEANNFLTDHLIVGMSICAILKNLYGSLFAGQLYFLLSLFLIRLLLPITRKIIACSDYQSCIIVIAYIIIYQNSIPFIEPLLKVPGQDPILNALWGAQFYMGGICLFKFRDRISSGKIVISLLFLFICFSIIGTLFVGAPVVGLATEWLFLLSLFCVMKYYQTQTSILKALGERTMDIYLMHVPIVMKLFSIVINRAITIPILTYILIVLGSLVASLILSICIRTVPYGYLIFGEVRRSN
jgi:surface polysaccharide O-acyltransferase-like enzyme